jgi:hypothetical protein
MSSRYSSVTLAKILRETIQDIESSEDLSPHDFSVRELVRSLLITIGDLEAKAQEQEAVSSLESGAGATSRQCQNVVSH